MNTPVSDLSEAWRGGRSLCQCNHLGDKSIAEPNPTQHAGAIGHGKCLMFGCPCMKFTFKRYTPEFDAALKKAMSFKKSE